MHQGEKGSRTGGGCVKGYSEQDARSRDRGIDSGKPSEAERARNGRPQDAERYGAPPQPGPRRTVGDQPKPEMKRGLAICASGFVPPVEIQVAEVLGFRERADMERGGGPATSEAFLRTVLGYEGEVAFKKVRVDKVEDFFGCLKEEPAAVSRVVFIGHGNAAGALGLAGEIQATNVKITVRVDKGALDAVRKNAEMVAAIRSRLAPDAVCDLCTCDVGQNSDFVAALADLLARPVRALKGTVIWRRRQIELALGKDKGKSVVQPTGLLAYQVHDERGEVTRRVGFEGEGLTVQQLFDTLRPDPVKPRGAAER